MADEKSNKQSPETTRQTPHRPVRRTNLVGIIVSIALVSAFVGAIGGYVGGVVAGSRAALRSGTPARNSHNRLYQGQATPWGMYNTNGNGSSDSGNSSSNTGSGNAT